MCRHDVKKLLNGQDFSIPEKGVVKNRSKRNLLWTQIQINTHNFFFFKIKRKVIGEEMQTTKNTLLALNVVESEISFIQFDGACCNFFKRLPSYNKTTRTEWPVKSQFTYNMDIWFCSIIFQVFIFLRYTRLWLSMYFVL